MSDGKHWREKLALSFQKLSPKSGDVIVMNFPPDTPHEQMGEVANEFGEELPEGVTVMALREGMTIELLSEEEMNRTGWYKMGTIQ